MLLAVVVLPVRRMDGGTHLVDQVGNLKLRRLQTHRGGVRFVYHETCKSHLRQPHSSLQRCLRVPASWIVSTAISTRRLS
uniref:Uncharacterized protein n=1 Tax=Arundo donax TaxID=35708 RepID=A0A0A9E3H2_ARUDO